MSETLKVSRLAKNPIRIPKGVDVSISEDAIVAKGPKGTHQLKVDALISLVKENDTITITANEKNAAFARANHKVLKRFTEASGTHAATIKNLVKGVAEGFERKLQLVGVGYKAQVQGSKLTLNLGKAHADIFDAPEGITIQTPSPTDIIITGVDKVLVSQVAAQIRKFREPECYKGKGIRFVASKDFAAEVITLKETKKK